ncbi:MAG: hypothetical protein GY787_30320 [Alteromonadales bacterium]|nr:hypothetical protein [Alteromonadales bacterium]
MIGYQEVEDGISSSFKSEVGKEINIPDNIKASLGLISTRVHSVNSDICKQHDSKTDVLVTFSDGKKLKISVKKDNADYFGNWYTHQRIQTEFGNSALQKLTDATTAWANKWIRMPNSSFFLGVSINFGSRRGNTFMNFNDIFNQHDIRTIVQGHNLNLDTSANVLLQTSSPINTMDEIMNSLQPFDFRLLTQLFRDVKIVFRAINPSTEGSNRGKQTYTKFVPNKKFTTPTLLTTKDDLIAFGRFETVDFNTEFKLNHNHVIKGIASNYNMQVNVK